MGTPSHPDTTTKLDKYIYLRLVMKQNGNYLKQYYYDS